MLSKLQKAVYVKNAYAACRYADKLNAEEGFYSDENWVARYKKLQALDKI